MRVGLDGRYIRDDFPGIGRYVYNLAMALPAIAPDVQIFLLRDADAPDTRYGVAALAAQSNLHLIEAGIPIRSMAEQVRLPGVARRLSLSVFHAPYYITAYRMPCRQVVTIYDVISARYPEYLPSPAMRLVFEVTTRLALRTADHILTLSQASRQDLVALYRVDPARISVTPLAADPRLRPAHPDAIDRLKRRLGLPERYVLYVGINKPHKNLTRLVEAWAQIAQYAARTTLVIAGHEDPRYPQARQRAAALGLDSVAFLGPVAEEDLPALYSGAELFVFPSLYEGFGLPVVEAMACGTPVACSNVSSLPEVAGDAALLFDPHTPEAIATAIQQVLRDTDLRAVLRQRGLEQAGQFSWERTARLTLEAYRSLDVRFQPG
ncbi:MAG: glycosyltransferase family 1 protein [Chloroflexi bacterium]|nr:MAG: glycosyltransferase family 1 protein [Chloroflexota bacterium]